jgi:hypothetical protein
MNAVRIQLEQAIAELFWEARRGLDEARAHWSDDVRDRADDQDEDGHDLFHASELAHWTSDPSDHDEEGILS